MNNTYPLYHKHVYSIVSRHTLKHTMQKFENIKNHRGNHRNQNNQRGQGNNYQNHRENKANQQKHNFQTHVHFGRHESESLFLLVVLVFSIVFDRFCVDLFGCFGFFGFPDNFLMFSNVLLIPQKGSDVDALLC